MFSVPPSLSLARRVAGPRIAMMGCPSGLSMRCRRVPLTLHRHARP